MKTWLNDKQHSCFSSQELCKHILTNVYYLSPKKLDAWIEGTQGKTFIVTGKNKDMCLPILRLVNSVISINKE